MNYITLFLKGIVFPLVIVAGLNACGEQSAPVETTVSGGLGAAEGEGLATSPRKKLEEILLGVWIAENPGSLDGAVEKIQLDFRANKEVTMIVFNPGEGEPLNGVYEVSGDDLKILFNPEEPVKTTYDGTVLTVIDVANDQQVGFEKL